ncbi:MAG: Cys-tRNA(Pro) deacylase [Roseiflexaceae bacterium]
MKQPTKTNAARVLDRAGVAYRIRTYTLPEDAEFSAVAVAEAVGVEPERLFKTLIVEGEQTGHLFALIPANTELNLRALASASGNKRVALAALRDVLALTGYLRGAVTPLAAKTAYPVFIDETIELWPEVGLSAGMRGLQVLLAPEDLIRVTQARLADIASQA